MDIYLDNNDGSGAVVHPVNDNPVVFYMNFSVTSFVMTQDLSTFRIGAKFLKPLPELLEQHPILPFNTR